MDSVNFLWKIINVINNGEIYKTIPARKMGYSEILSSLAYSPPNPVIFAYILPKTSGNVSILGINIGTV